MANRFIFIGLFLSTFAMPGVALSQALHPDSRALFQPRPTLVDSTVRGETAHPRIDAAGPTGADVLARSRTARRLAAVADSAAADRRWRGALIGGVGLGLAAGLVAAAFCEVGDCTRKGVEAALVGGFIGAGVGAMIGTAIPKK